jgi:hypothetical protein
MSSKNRHDTRSTLVPNIVTPLVVYFVVYVVVYVVVEHWNLLLLCGETLCHPSLNHTTAKTDLPLYSSFVYGDQSSSSTGSQIHLSVAGLGDILFCFVSKTKFCVWTNLWVSLSFSSGRCGVSGYWLFQY